MSQPRTDDSGRQVQQYAYEMAHLVYMSGTQPREADQVDVAFVQSAETHLTMVVFEKDTRPSGALSNVGRVLQVGVIWDPRALPGEDDAARVWEQVRAHPSMTQWNVSVITSDDPLLRGRYQKTWNTPDDCPIQVVTFTHDGSLEPFQWVDEEDEAPSYAVSADEFAQLSKAVLEHLGHSGFVRHSAPPIVVTHQIAPDTGRRPMPPPGTHVFEWKQTWTAEVVRTFYMELPGPASKNLLNGQSLKAMQGLVDAWQGYFVCRRKGCTVQASKGKPLKRCPCHLGVSYCSKACQKADWSRHKLNHRLRVASQMASSV